jgi:hypothetical protein
LSDSPISICKLIYDSERPKRHQEEFETALGQIMATNKPRILIYNKNTYININSSHHDDLSSKSAFMKKLEELEHFPRHYENIAELKLHFNEQLNKLSQEGFFEHEIKQPYLIFESTYFNQNRYTQRAKYLFLIFPPIRGTLFFPNFSFSLSRLLAFRNVYC